MKTTRRHLLAGLSALAVAPLLAACGEDEATSGTDEPAAPEAAGAFPVTIAHKYGETTLEKAPTRVVCVGLTEQDALLALGIVPVAVTKWFGDAPGYIFSWASRRDARWRQTLWNARTAPSLPRMANSISPMKSKHW